MYSFRDQLQPVLTSFLRFFAVPVCGSCILKLSGTGPVRGPSKKGNRTETGPDFKALSRITAMGSCVGHQVVVAVVEPKLEWSGNGCRSSVESMHKWGTVLVVGFECRSLHRYVPVVHSECRWLRDGRCPQWWSGSLVCHLIPEWGRDRCWVWNQVWIPL